MYVDTDTQEVLPVAGYLVDNVSAIVLQFEKTHSERRRAILKKHSIMPLEASAYFKITGQGLSDA